MDYYGAREVCREAMDGHKRANTRQMHSFFNLYKGKNICTANIAGYLSLRDRLYIAEISFGSGMYPGTYVFGVTVIEKVNGHWTRSKLSKACSQVDLSDYIDQLDETD
jgi:hypothetical protein